MSRVAVVSVDGVPMWLWRRLLESGRMPRLAEAGAGRETVRLRSVHPCESATAWSSYMTGTNPGRHGIFGFADRDLGGGGGLALCNSRRLHGRTLWERCAAEGRRPVAINVPVTWPPPRLDGVVVGGFLAPGVEGIAWPSSLGSELARRGYRADPDNSLARTDLAAFHDDLLSVERTRVDFALDLFAREEWDLFHCHLMGTDRLMHFCWDAWESGDPEWIDRFEGTFTLADEAVGRILDALPADVGLVVLSDHGFCRLESEVDLNAALVESGLLRLGGDPAAFMGNVLPGSTAFAMVPGRVYVNLEGREPNGSVEVAGYEEARSRTADALLSLRSADGKPVIQRVFRREEIYADDAGGHADGWLGGTPAGTAYELAPDLVAWPHDGFDLKAGFGEGPVFGRGHISGMHTWQDAVLWVPGESPRADGSIVDVAPSILGRLGLPADGCDGSPLF